MGFLSRWLQRIIDRDKPHYETITIPTVLGIWRVENETIVLWSDYTRTKVQLSGTDKDDPYNAFCAALAKKTYGTNSALKKKITKNTYGVDTWFGAQFELAHFHPEMFTHLNEWY